MIDRGGKDRERERGRDREAQRAHQISMRVVQSCETLGGGAYRARREIMTDQQ